MDKRYAFTIIYDGLHHLLNKDWFLFMIENFDHWVIVEGLADNQGSTWWCNSLDQNKTSTDGTLELLDEISKEVPWVTVVKSKDKWNSKDEMVQQVHKYLPKKKGHLYQVDADEHWTTELLEQVENYMSKSYAKTGSIKFNHRVKNYIARGYWGDGFNIRYWKYTPGDQFRKHEPPTMSGQGIVVRLPGRVDHYSYVFEKDIIFKEKYYRGYEGILERWRAIDGTQDVMPISALFPRNNSIGRSKTKLIKES